MKTMFALSAACAATLLAACSGMPSQDMSYASRNGGEGPMATAPAARGTTAMGAMESTKMVGGAPMYPSKTIVENAVNSKDHTTLVAAVKAAGLVDTLQGAGPFTVFAPTNMAFDALPAGTVPTLLKPENKATLAKVLTYHVVPGRLDATALAGQIRAGGGKAMLRTVEGEPLVATMQGSDIVVTDAKGGMARVTTSDVYQSNGVIHVVDKVLLPG